MRLENMFKTIEILKYIKEKPNSNVPKIRDFLEISHSDPPSQEEKTLYKLISILSKYGYIEKRYVKKRELGGVHFSLSITPLGESFFKQIGITGDELDPTEKKKLLDDLEVSLRLIIKSKLKGKISKPLQIELSSELSGSIMEYIRSFLENLTLIDILKKERRSIKELI